jgi:hypothetical protein
LFFELQSFLKKDNFDNKSTIAKESVRLCTIIIEKNVKKNVKIFKVKIEKNVHTKKSKKINLYVVFIGVFNF